MKNKYFGKLRTELLHGSKIEDPNDLETGAFAYECWKELPSDVMPYVFTRVGSNIAVNVRLQNPGKVSRIQIVNRIKKFLEKKNQKFGQLSVSWEDWNGHALESRPKSY